MQVQTMCLDARLLPHKLVDMNINKKTNDTDFRNFEPNSYREKNKCGALMYRIRYLYSAAPFRAIHFKKNCLCPVSQARIDTLWQGNGAALWQV